MIKFIIVLIILLTSSCGNPPSTPPWSIPEAEPIYGRTVFEDDEITVIEILEIDPSSLRATPRHGRDGDEPSHLTLKNDID